MMFWFGAALLLCAGGVGGQWWYQRTRRRCRLLAQLRELLEKADAYIKNVGGDKQGFLKTLEEKIHCTSCYARSIHVRTALRRLKNQRRRYF